MCDFIFLFRIDLHTNTAVNWIWNQKKKICNMYVYIQSKINACACVLGWLFAHREDCGVCCKAAIDTYRINGVD